MQFRLQTLLIAFAIVAVCFQCNSCRRFQKGSIAYHSNGDQTAFNKVTYGWPFGIYERNRRSEVELVGETKSGHKIFNVLYYSKEMSLGAVFANCFVATALVLSVVWLIRKMQSRVIVLKRIDKKRAFFLAITFAGCVIALAAWWWFSLKGWEPVSRGTALSTFEVPAHLDANQFAKRLTEVGFAEVNNADFESFLPKKYRGSAVAPGNAESDYKSMKAFKHRDNTDSMTRVIGYDASKRKVHYFRSQVNTPKSGEGQPVGNVSDTIEEELRK